MILTILFPLLYFAWISKSVDLGRQLLQDFEVIFPWLVSFFAYLLGFHITKEWSISGEHLLPTLKYASQKFQWLFLTKHITLTDLKDKYIRSSCMRVLLLKTYLYAQEIQQCYSAIAA